MQINQKIFSVRDSKSETYSTPWFQPTTASGIRLFSRMAQEPQSMIHVCPNDFALFELGEVNLETAQFNMLAQPVNLGLANQFLEGEGVGSELAPASLATVS